MTKLLDKPLKAFTIYALIVLLCSIPAYFLIIDLIWVYQVNEHNQVVSRTTKKNISALKLDDAGLDSAIRLWNRLQPETNIRPAGSLKADSTYNVYRHDADQHIGTYDRFQGLVTYFELNGKPYSLTVESNVEESYETIIAIALITIVFFIILLVGFIRLNKRISKKLWKPFYQTLDQIKTFDLNSHKAIDFEENNIAEFEELNSSINKLIRSNVAVFHQQKEFTENASHELQTPLAIMQSKLDLLMQDPSLTSDQSYIIEELNYAMSRVSRINKNLLLLAKIENQQFADLEEIRITDMIGEILELLSNLFEAKTIHFRCDSEPSLKGNRMLVEIMLNNLLMNALRHTDADAEVDILLSDSELIISNKGLAALDADRLFRRFSVASSQTPGSGLGLSIVKEICNRYQWTVRYEFADHHHRFIIRF